jgi:hypothetical protein
MCCGGIGTSDPPSGTIRQVQSTHTHPRDATSVADVVRGQLAHMQLKFYHSNCSGTHYHHHVLRWIGTSDPPLWHHKTRLPHPTTHTCPGTSSVVEVVWGHLAHAAQILPFHCPCQHHHAAVGLALQIHPLVP